MSRWPRVQAAGPDKWLYQSIRSDKNFTIDRRFPVSPSQPWTFVPLRLMDTHQRLGRPSITIPETLGLANRRFCISTASNCFPSLTPTRFVPCCRRKNVSSKKYLPNCTELATITSRKIKTPRPITYALLREKRLKRSLNHHLATISRIGNLKRISRDSVRSLSFRKISNVPIETKKSIIVLIFHFSVRKDTRLKFEIPTPNCSSQINIPNIVSFPIRLTKRKRRFLGGWVERTSNVTAMQYVTK